MTPPPDPPVPVTVLTGFLGAGKTTLLNGLLRQPALAETAVLVNEFGEVGIDHLLVERVEGDLLWLSTGCVCCAARGDLITALADLLARRTRGEVSFKRIVIETTGLADPAPILNALLPSAAIGGDRCRLDRLVTVVDAEAGCETLGRAPEAARQVAMADLVVLSKRDRLPPGDATTLAVIEAGVRRLNPAVPILASADPASVVDALRSPAPPALVPSGLHGADHHRHLTGIAALVLRAGRIAPRRFDGFLDRLLDRHGAHLLRLKGLVATSDQPDRPILVNVVQHRVHPATKLDRWPDSDHDTRLVAILQHGRPAEVGALWDAFFGPPRVDQADAAAFVRDVGNGPGLF